MKSGVAETLWWNADRWRATCWKRSYVPPRESELYSLYVIDTDSPPTATLECVTPISCYSTQSTLIGAAQAPLATGYQARPPKRSKANAPRSTEDRSPIPCSAKTWPIAGANLNPWPEQAFAWKTFGWFELRSKTNDSSGVMV